MKSHTEYLTFNVPARMDFINITHQVEEIVRQSGIQEGLVLCNAMHITASVFINDDEPGLHEDYRKRLEGRGPCDPSPTRCKHNRSAGVDARRATPPDPRLPRSWLAGCRQLDPSHPALVTCEDAEIEPCRKRRWSAETKPRSGGIAVAWRRQPQGF